MPESPVKPIKKPPYLLGLLCIIPLIGAFVGLGLLLYALIYYKDKWLAIIGGAGILFTVLVYSTLFYFFGSDKAFRQGYVSIAEIQLNDIVRGIEFYRLQYNKYPDSLQQLTNKGSYISIYDPTHSVNKGTSYYYYRNMGDKYTVFSAGLDGVPHTKDDIYPAVFISDSSKIGLIVPAPPK